MPPSGTNRVATQTQAGRPAAQTQGTAKSAESDIFAKHAKSLAKAADHSKDLEQVNDTSGQLPPGIENGIARLVELKVGEYATGANVGKPYFSGSATVVEPAEYAGMYTRIGPEPLFDTPGRRRATLQGDDPSEAHMPWVQNEIKKLLPKNLSEAAKNEAVSGANIGKTMKSLSKQGPHFRFRTWVGSMQVIKKHTDGKWYVFNRRDDDEDTDRIVLGKSWTSEAAAKAANPYAGREPNVQHTWAGWVEYSGEPAAALAKDNTAAPSTNGDGHHTEEVAAVDTDVVPDEEAPEGTGEYTDQGDLDSLAQRADDDQDAEAITELERIAAELGLADDEGNFPGENYAEMVEHIRSAQGGEGGDESAEGNGETEWQASAATCKYEVLVKGKKTKVDCEIVENDPEARTVTLKNLTTGQVIGTKQKVKKTIKGKVQLVEELVPTVVSYDDIESNE